ncbi:MAG TPA: helix-turn-helix domain-containing protein [Candidatus Paenibacillus intestinavium]|nr:helix-turn-helix domain-containing protein [Candidatus Paenibacillus intestinavium]
MTAGALLKACRERAGISQIKMAMMMNRTQSSISKLEKDRNPIDVETFRDWTKFTNSMDIGIAFLYGVDPATILQSLMQITGVA